MTKQFVSILSFLAATGYTTAEILFKGSVKQDTGHFFTVAKKTEGQLLLARVRDGSVGVSHNEDDYRDAGVPLVFGVRDDQRIAAQLRELADWFEQQTLTGEEKSGQYDALIAGTGPNDA